MQSFRNTPKRSLERSRLGVHFIRSLQKTILFTLIIAFSLSSASFAADRTPAKISSGGYHSLRIRSNGTLWAWGDNTFGQLGDGTYTTRYEPVQIGYDTDWKHVSAGMWHSLAVKKDGSLYAWGMNGGHVLGLGDTYDEVDEVLVPTRVGTSKTWVQVAAGAEHNAGIRSDGSLWTWGANYDGELGQGLEAVWSNVVNVPTRIGTGTNWIQVSAGASHTVALRSDGTLWATGSDAEAQLGDGDYNWDQLSTTFQQVGGDEATSDWDFVDAGARHNLAIKKDGSLWGWGDDYNYQVGVGSAAPEPYPVRLTTHTTWVQASGGENYTFGRQSDGSLWSWGYNDQGQLGDDTPIYRADPGKVDGIGYDWGWIEAAVAGYHTMALKTDGCLYGWGDNEAGQIGDGTTTDRDHPVAVGSCEEVPTCVYVLEPEDTVVDKDGGIRQFEVMTTSDCTWKVVPECSWIQVTNGETGTGSGTVTLSIDPNSGIARSAYVTVEGEQYGVAQLGSGETCAYEVVPAQTTPALSGDGGSYTFAIGTTASCPWSVSTNDSWITITSETSGTGPWTVNYTVAANPDSESERTGTITVTTSEGDIDHTVVQSGGSCTYDLVPTSATVGSDAGNGSFTLVTLSGCSWTAASNRTWLSITSQTTGNGPWIISYSFTENTGSERSGTISVGGEDFAVTQEALSADSECSYTIAPQQKSVGEDGSGVLDYAIAVGTTSECSWTAATDDAWITFTNTPSGTGSGTVRYSVDSNAGGEARTGLIAIEDQYVTVYQDGSEPSCNYTLFPVDKEFDSAGGTGAFTVTCGGECDWTATSNNSWIDITSGSEGTGPGTVSYSVTYSGRADSRTGTITVAGETYTVSQSANPAGGRLMPGVLELLLLREKDE